MITKNKKSFFLLVCILLCLFFSNALAEDRLIIKDNSGNTIFNVQEDGMMTVVRGAYPVIVGERKTNLTTGARSVANFIHSTTADMTDGFGPEFAFTIKDADATEAICTIGAVRDGSDNSGAYAVWPRNNGVKFQAMTVHANGSLEMSNGAMCTAAGTWEDASSRSLKKDIKNLTKNDALTTLAQLKPVEFKYKADDSDTHLGFIAEDVPELVASKDRKHMNAMDVVALLTKVVQEQQDVIGKLSKEIESLKKAVNNESGI